MLWAKNSGSQALELIRMYGKYRSSICWHFCCCFCCCFCCFILSICSANDSRTLNYDWCVWQSILKALHYYHLKDALVGTLHDVKAWFHENKSNLTFFSLFLLPNVFIENDSHLAVPALSWIKWEKSTNFHLPTMFQLWFEFQCSFWNLLILLLLSFSLSCSPNCTAYFWCWC